MTAGRAFAVVASLALAGACKDREPASAPPHATRSDIYAVYALDDGSSLAIVETVETDRQYSVERIDDQGTTRWQTPLRGSARVERGTLVDHGTAYVRHIASGSSFVAAIAVETGAVRWDSQLGPAISDDDGGRQLSEAMFDGILVEALSHDQTTVRGETTMLGVDPADGNVLWSNKLRYDPGTAIITSHLLVLHQPGPDGVYVFDRAGFRGHLHPLGRGCAWKGTYLMLESRKQGAMLVEIDPTTLTAARVVAGPIAPARSHKDGPWLESCGSYGDKLVLTVLDDPVDQQIGHNYVVILDAGKVSATAALGGGFLQSVDTTARPDLSSLSGELTRFVPVLMGGSESDKFRSHLSMLDLERATIAWRGPGEDTIQLGDVFRSGTRWYLMSDHAVLSVFDGTTGELAAAVEVDATAALSFEPEQLGRDDVWLSTPTGIAARFAVLDASTLAPKLVRDLKVTDATQHERKRLGR